jgi:glycosyltransferase involved in cell wall biosynthesis
MISDILFIKRKWKSHYNISINSPVDLLLFHLDKNQYVKYDGARLKLHSKIKKFLKDKTNSKKWDNYGTPYTSDSVEFEFFGIFRYLLHFRKIKYIFFPFGDYDYYYAGFLKKFFNIKIILYSFFSIEELQNRYKNLDHLNRADLIFTAGSAEMFFLRKNIQTRIEHLPLALDFEYLKENIIRRKMFLKNLVEGVTINIIHVGINRRDFKLLDQIISLTNQKKHNVHFHLVGNLPDFMKKNWESNSKVTFHENIEYQNLFDLYIRADIGLLCLSDAASSSTFMEYIAFGLPTIVNDFPTIREYGDDNSAFYVPKLNQEEEFVKYIELLLKDKNLRIEKSHLAMEYSLKYDILNIKTKFHDSLVNF